MELADIPIGTDHTIAVKQNVAYPATLTGQDCDWRSGAVFEYPGNLPAIEHLARYTGEPFGKWDCVVIAEDEAITDVELRVSAVCAQGQAGILKIRDVIHQNVQHVRNIVGAVGPGVIGIEGQTVAVLL